MFQSATDKQVLFKQLHDSCAKDLLKSKGDLSPLAMELQKRGVVMNYYSLSTYLDMSLVHTISMTKALNLAPIMSSALPYFFRPDIWDLLPDIKIFMRKNCPDNVHVATQHELVDSFDLCLFYGIKRHVCRRLMAHYTLKKVKMKRNAGYFYLLKDILRIKEDTLFQKAICRSVLSVSAAMIDKIRLKALTSAQYIPHEVVMPYRDMDCPQYLSCLDVAATTTNYMNCKKCLHWQRRDGHISEDLFKPELVFLPLNNRRDASQLKNIEVFPNAF